MSIQAPAFSRIPLIVRKSLKEYSSSDIHDDLLKNPLDEELKTMAQEFGILLKHIIQSVDRFGLKKRHLQKHRKPVTKFLSSVRSKELHSPVANGYKQRFEKTGAKMFTFLDHDGVPWHNNYAEHAIKRFSKYRRLFDGLYTEDSLNEYLILRSILNTCELNNVNALNFLLSEEKSLDGLRRTANTNSRAKQSRMSNDGLTELRRVTSTAAPHATPHSSVHISCTDSTWKERCRNQLKARQGIELSDFDADADRNWCHQQAARHGGRCMVRSGADGQSLRLQNYIRIHRSNKAAILRDCGQRTGDQIATACYDLLHSVSRRL